METLTFTRTETDMGPFSFLTDHEGRVVSSGWTLEPRDLLARLHSAGLRQAVKLREGACPHIDKAIEAYHSGDFSALDTVPVFQTGSEWYREVWRVLRQVPPGEVLSYAELAQSAGRPRAVRAAASACARNAVALFVPCHRVLRSDGHIGGFAWGESIKYSLLVHEGVNTRQLALALDAHS